VRDIFWKWEMLKEEICLLKSYYMSILTHGTEIWTWTKLNISKLMATEMRFLRSTKVKTKREITKKENEVKTKTTLGKMSHRRKEGRKGEEAEE
jgi:hypothetical protein